MDEALDMAVDGAGNVYVTGFERGTSGTGKNFLTIKYNPNGDTLWTRIYSYSSNENEQANSIAVDGSGNVIVTGQSDSDPTTVTNDDYATVKYNSNGVQQWAMRYNGPGNARDRAVKVVADASGNVFVTGRSDNGTNDDYVTIKYNASGVSQWVKAYDGNYTDRATDMAIDATGNVYVTGRSSNGSNPDIVTVKYNTSGTVMWSGLYDNVDYDIPTAITLDNAGNVYVTGQSDVNSTALFSYNYVTLKYNTSGAQQWVKLYDNAGNDDIANDIKVDKSGNVYVTGLSDADASALINNNYVTLKYNATGVQQWAKSYNGTANSTDEALALTLDASDNILVTGRSTTPASQFDGVTLKYDPNGNQLGLFTYTGQGDNTDMANDMVLDAQGNIIVVGTTSNLNTDWNMSVVKLKSAGDTLWARELTGTFSGSTDEATAVAVDALNNIYVTGYTVNSYTSSDYTTIKYTANGDTVWVRKYNNIGESDRAFAIGLDATGNVYVTGRSDTDPSVNTNYDIVTIKYNSSGVQQWVAKYTGKGNKDDFATTLGVGASTIVIGGRANNGTNDDALVVAYTPSGTQAWAQVYDGGTGDDRFSSLALDANENVFVTGRTFNGTNFDYLTMKYSSAGVQGWVSKYQGVGNGDDIAVALALDKSGNVLVTGQSDSDLSATAINFDYATLQYSSLGVQKWVSRFNGSGNGDDLPADIALDVANTVYVTGQSYNGPSKGFDYATIAYSSAGVTSSPIYYNGSKSKDDIATAIVIDQNNIAYVTGNSEGPTSQTDVVTIKYSYAPLGIEEVFFNANAATISPNPFHTETTIEVKPAMAGTPLSFFLYDMRGLEVKNFQIVNSQKILLHKDGLPEGIYVFKIFANNQVVQLGKLIIQ
jgi:uncharacterized delta-60 repeat protein